MQWIRLWAVLVLLAGCATEAPSPSESTRPARGDPQPGTITFGSAVNQRTLQVNNPKTSFRLNQQVAWSASLARPVDGTKVNIVISRSGDDTELFGYEQFITDPGATTFVNRMQLGRFLAEPGSYLMRYVTTEGEVVAEGEFELIGQN